MPMPTGNGENPQFYGQWTVEDSQNGLCAKSLQRQRILSAWIPGLLTLKIQGSVPLWSHNPKPIQGLNVISAIETDVYLIADLLLSSWADKIMVEDTARVRVLTVYSEFTYARYNFHALETRPGVYFSNQRVRTSKMLWIVPLRCRSSLPVVCVSWIWLENSPKFD